MKSKALLFILAAIALSACQFSLAQDVTPPPDYQPPEVSAPLELPDELYPASAPDAAAGAAIYAEKCAPCHGDTGRGDGPQANQLPVAVAPIGLPDLARESSPADWFRTITLGNLDNFMPPFANSLTEQERWNVLAYVYSLSAPADVVEQGRVIYAAQCAACHGETGRSDGPDAPEDTPNLADPAFMSARSGETLFQTIHHGTGGGDHAFQDVLSEEEAWFVVAYLRSLIFPLPQAENFGADFPATPQAEIAVTEQPAESEVGDENANLGTVSGQLMNGSGGQMPRGLKVTLFGYDHLEERINRQTTAGADGAFEFAQVDLQPGRIFFASVEYDGVTYTSEFSVVEEDQTALETTITLYETTTDVTNLSIERAHIFFEFPAPGLVQVIHLYVISNHSDRTVTASAAGEAMAAFDLPEGYTNLTFQQGEMGDEYISTESGFGVTRPIVPGEDYQLLFAYELPFARRLDFQVSFALPVGATIIFLPEQGYSVRGEDLQEAGTQAVNEAIYKLYAGLPVSAGDALELQVSRSGLGVPLDAGLYIGAGAFLAALGGVMYWLRRGSDAPSHDSPEALMDAMIALDDQYAADEIKEDMYRQQREELKARLRSLVEKGG